MKSIHILTLISTAIVLSACGGDWGPEDDGDGFGDDLSVTEDVATFILHQNTVLESGVEHAKKLQFFPQQADYEDELINYTSDSAENVDFDQYQVVLIDMGMRSLSDSAVTISGAYEEEGIVTLEVRYTIPSDNCTDTGNSTDYNPYVFVRVETTLELVVSESGVQTDCN